MSNLAPPAPPGASTIDLQHVRRTFDGRLSVIDDLSLRIDPGEFLAIVGPSGCGKSTLLRLLAGLDRPDGGTVQMNRQRIACVFQDANLLPWRNALRNVELPLEIAGHSKSARRSAAREALARVGLADFADRYPAKLSGGMRMRVSLARALVVNPDLLLLDEPFAALDEITRVELDDQLRSLWKQQRMTVIFVTHSLAEAAYLSNRVIVSTTRPMRIALDYRLQLPPKRDDTLRASPEFAAEIGVLLKALRKGGAP